MAIHAPFFWQVSNIALGGPSPELISPWAAPRQTPVSVRTQRTPAAP